jgi:hypothetical protein
MSRPTKITIAIITFHKDFLLLKNLLNSIYTYWNPDEIDSIKILLNDQPTYVDEFNQLIDEMTVPNFKIDKMFSQELQPSIRYLDWFSQQLFKCVISEKITTDWYLINDCKDAYTMPVCIEDCFNEHGQATMHLDHMRYGPGVGIPESRTHWGFGPFRMSFENSCKIFGVDIEDCKGYRLPFITPFFVKTSRMQDMVNELRSSMKGFFPFLFSLHLDGQSFLTEFLLFSAYCYSKNKLEDYVDWSYNNRKFFNSVKQDPVNRKTDGSRKS